MIILLTGGSKNGKSYIAEKIVESIDYNYRYYIATMEPYCEEALVAINRHKKMREQKGFITIEKYTNIHEIELEKNSIVLLECICNLCANEMFSDTINPIDKILNGINLLTEKTNTLIIVTNQVGDDGLNYEFLTSEYIKNMGIINNFITEKSDCVIEVVYGIPFILKGEMPKCISLNQ